MKSRVFAFWLVCCIVISLLVAIAVPGSSAFGNVMTAVASGLVGYLVLCSARVIPPPLLRRRRRQQNNCMCPSCRPDLYRDDDNGGSGYDGWMQGPDLPNPPYPYPPSRN